MSQSNYPQNQQNQKYFSFCSIQRDSAGDKAYITCDGAIYQLKEQIVQANGVPTNLLTFSVQLSNIASKVNYNFGNYDPVTKVNSPILLDTEESTFINVEIWSEHLIKRFKGAGVKERDRLTLVGVLKKTWHDKNQRYYLNMSLNEFKILKRSEPRVEGGQPFNLGTNQPVAPTFNPGYPNQPVAPRQTTAPFNPGYPEQQATPYYNQDYQPQVFGGNPDFNSGGIPAPDYSTINISDDDLPF